MEESYHLFPKGMMPDEVIRMDEYCQHTISFYAAISPARNRILLVKGQFSPDR